MSSSLFLWVGTKNNLLRSIVEQIAAKELNMSLEVRVDADGLKVSVFTVWFGLTGHLSQVYIMMRSKIDSFGLAKRTSASPRP